MVDDEATLATIGRPTQCQDRIRIVFLTAILDTKSLTEDATDQIGRPSFVEDLMNNNSITTHMSVVLEAMLIKSVSKSSHL